MCRTILKLQQDHSKTLAQIERLKRALDEHSLELRVKAANEAETLYQQRLAAAEAEIAEYHLRLDDSERFYFSLFLLSMLIHNPTVMYFL